VVRWVTAFGRIEGELDVAAASDVEGADDLDGGRPEHLVLVVGQRLTRGHHDGVAGVDAHRVDVLHVADDDAGVGSVAEHLVLQLLPADQRLLD
jgi:hypothetical protein